MQAKRWVVWLLTVAAILGGRAPAAQAVDLVEANLVDRARLDAIVKPFVDDGWFYGVAVGLVNEKGMQFAGYGRTSEADAEPPKPDTEFEIGSISKVFTGIVLAEMVEKKEVTLDEPVQKLLGESMTIPKGQREITLVDLATHSSGLPYMPNNFAPKVVTNPFADYTSKELGAFLGKHKLTLEPGKLSVYSNLGVGLLGHALAEARHTTYPDLIEQIICKPLALANTTVSLDDSQRRRLASGHDSDNNPVPHWDFDVLAGAGGVVSTTSDMTRFVAANLGLVDSPLSAAIRASHKVQFKVPTGADDVALCWQVRRGSAIIWHNGQTAGYHALAAFSPEKKLGIVVLASTGSMRVDAMGFRVLELLTTGKAEPVPLPATVQLTAEQLEPLLGDYKIGPLTAKVTREESRLFIQVTGQSKFRIYPESKTRFYLRAVDAQLDFEADADADADGKVAKFILHQNGRDIPAERAEAGGS